MQRKMKNELICKGALGVLDGMSILGKFWFCFLSSTFAVETWKSSHCYSTAETERWILSART